MISGLCCFGAGEAACTFWQRLNKAVILFNTVKMLGEDQHPKHYLLSNASKSQEFLLLCGNKKKHI